MHIDTVYPHYVRLIDNHTVRDDAGQVTHTFDIYEAFLVTAKLENLPGTLPTLFDTPHYTVIDSNGRQTTLPADLFQPVARVPWHPECACPV